MPRIHLVLTDDWELRGNGSGNMPRIQFETMERLVEVYERHGLKASFSVEVMQQLKHLEAGAAEPVDERIGEDDRRPCPTRRGF